jgi:hypothetical protein
MAETVKRLRVKVAIEGEVAGDDGALLSVSRSYEYNFSDGNGDNQIGAVWQDVGANLATTTRNVDLDGIADFQGVTMSSNSAAKVILVAHKGTSGNLLVGGGDFSTPFNDATDKVKVAPGGLILMVAPGAGYGITASTGDVLPIESTASIDYDALFAFKNS